MTALPQQLWTGIETTRVTVHGYLLAVRFEKSGDLDLHAEIGPTPDWNTDHAIVEVPPGQEYCKARKALWKIVKSASVRPAWTTA